MEEKRKFEGELKPKEFKNQNETKDTIKRRGKLEIATKNLVSKYLRFYWVGK